MCALHAHGVTDCFSGLHVPVGTDYSSYLEKLAGRRCQSAFLLVVTTPALFDSKVPCAIHRAAAMGRGPNVPPRAPATRLLALPVFLCLDLTALPRVAPALRHLSPFSAWCGRLGVPG